MFLEAVTFQMVPNAVWIVIPTKVASLRSRIYPIDFRRVNQSSLLTFHYAEPRTNRGMGVRSEISCRLRKVLFKSMKWKTFTEASE